MPAFTYRVCAFNTFAQMKQFSAQKWFFVRLTDDLVTSFTLNMDLFLFLCYVVFKASVGALGSAAVAGPVIMDAVRARFGIGALNVLDVFDGFFDWDRRNIECTGFIRCIDFLPNRPSVLIDLKLLLLCTNFLPPRFFIGLNGSLCFMFKVKLVTKSSSRQTKKSFLSRKLFRLSKRVKCTNSYISNVQSCFNGLSCVHVPSHLHSFWLDFLHLLQEEDEKSSFQLRLEIRFAWTSQIL